MKHAAIYVPGIGDDTRGRQRRLIQVWCLFGVKPRIHEIPWGGQEPFAPKLEGLLALIDELASKGHKVSLVGASAGAGAVINAFAARKDKIVGVVCIAGKVNNPEGIGEEYRRRSPAFIESANRVQFSLDALDKDDDGTRKRIMSRYALIDLVVPREDSIVLGGKNQTVWTVGHSITIVTQLIFGAPFYLKWLKSLQNANE